MTIGPCRAFFAKSRVYWCAQFARHLGLLPLFFLLPVSAATGAPCTSAPPGLISWWPGDGNANTIFGTNNGSLVGTATASGLGMVGSAFSFDGTNSSVQIADSAVLHPTNLTIEAWVRFTGLDSAGL